MLIWRKWGVGVGTQVECDYIGWIDVRFILTHGQSYAKSSGEFEGTKTA